MGRSSEDRLTNAGRSKNGGRELRQSYGAGELARLAGVSTDTLRYYERQRLLAAPPRGANGYRLYPPETLRRVHVIRAALAVGFRVDELSRILRARDRGLAPCREVRRLAASKLQTLEARIRELQQLRQALSTTLAEWDEQLAKTPRGSQAGLLETLANTQTGITPGLSPLLAPALRRKLNRCGKQRNRKGPNGSKSSRAEG
jgi:DNA-binding transcriptional MerR regulator